MFHVPNEYRLKTPGHPLSSTDDDGNNGAFFVPFDSYEFTVIASDGMGWEHVSISLKNRCPNWKEMCHMKNLFWDKQDCVVQYHPSESEYVNNHEYTLHLWRSSKEKFPMPDSILIGFKDHEPT